MRNLSSENEQPFAWLDEKNDIGKASDTVFQPFTGSAEPLTQDQLYTFMQMYAWYKDIKKQDAVSSSGSPFYAVISKLWTGETNFNSMVWYVNGWNEPEVDGLAPWRNKITSVEERLQVIPNDLLYEQDIKRIYYAPFFYPSDDNEVV